MTSPMVVLRQQVLNKCTLFLYTHQPLYAVTSMRTLKRLVKISAQLYFIGDIAPDMPNISDGEAEVFGTVRKITNGMKARNPDGTVNYTRLDLM